jgi:acyl carrier protein
VEQAVDESLAERVRLFVAEQVGVRPDRVTFTTTLDKDLGLAGIDAEEFLVEFMATFNVDLTTLQFDRHFLPESPSLLQLLLFPIGLPLLLVQRIFRPPWLERWSDSKVIQISVGDLIEVVRAGRWLITYPLGK